MPNPVDLEPQAKAVVDANANPPSLFELGPEQGRRTVGAVSSGLASHPSARSFHPFASAHASPGSLSSSVA